MITDEQKRQFGELSMDFLETLQRDGSDRNLDPIMDEWEALEEKVGRLVVYSDILAWFSEPIFEQPVTLIEREPKIGTVSPRTTQCRPTRGATSETVSAAMRVVLYERAGRPTCRGNVTPTHGKALPAVNFE
jgi:hypothetical protein